MFQNRILGFVPNSASAFAMLPLATNAPGGMRPPQAGQPVQIADIYQAAKNRAVEDYELDKLFNPDFYHHGDGI
jgi:hypothetical protein